MLRFDLKNENETICRYRNAFASAKRSEDFAMAKQLVRF
jgi:hypothetical protein